MYCCLHYLVKVKSRVATSIVHSKLDYCNLLYYNLPQSQIKRHQNIHNSLTRAVTRTSTSSHVTHVLKSLQWLKINERIKYKLMSLTYKVLTTNQPQYLHNLISVQPRHNLRSSSMVTLARPPTRSSLKLTNRSFRYAVPCLWRASSDTVSFTFSYHTWQFIIIFFTIFTITTCIFSYSLSLSF